jgi:phosphoribosylanthranilate isomerase
VMKRPLVVKVCGLTRGENIEAVVEAGADMVGFIFAPQSPRLATAVLSPVQLEHLGGRVRRVGIFRDADYSTVLEFVRRYFLDAVQLHGNESPEFCRKLKEYLPDLEVSRAFAISEEFDAEQMSAFYGCCDWFVFDAACDQGGGSGQSFQWSILERYTGEVPFLLAGGIGKHNAKEAIECIAKHPSGWGLDINSRVETEVGVKSVTLTAAVIAEVRCYGLGK